MYFENIVGRIGFGNHIFSCYIFIFSLWYWSNEKGSIPLAKWFLLVSLARLKPHHSLLLVPNI